MYEQAAKDTAEALLSIEAMTFRFNPPYTYTTGLKSPIYLDNRLIMSYPAIRKRIVKNYINVIKENIGLDRIDCISATATAAIPQGAWVSWELNLPMVYVRPQTKSYGKEGKVEGVISKNSRVLIIEDHITTGLSVVGNALAIREIGGKVDFCVTTTTYEAEASIQLLKKHHVTLFPLTTGRTIVEAAHRQKLISDGEKASVESWFADPPSWDKNKVI